MKSKYGWVEIDGIRYDHDVIMHTDRSVIKRSKKKSKKFKKQFGHTPLSDFDLLFLDNDGADIIYIGTGQYGDLPITTEAHSILLKREAIIRPTPEILGLLEDECRPFAAVIHVCC
jgi:hypothetical protein